jgi:hypothetical protein
MGFRSNLARSFWIRRLRTKAGDGGGGTHRSAAAHGRGVAGVRLSGAPGVRSGCGSAEGGVRGMRSPPVGLSGFGEAQSGGR